MKRPLRLVVTGAAGRMGRRVSELACADRRFQITARVDRAAGPGLSGPDALPEALRAADVLLDFSSPASAVRFVAAAARSRKAAVVGTTGLSPAQTSRLKAASRRIPLFMCPNFSPGVHVLCALARIASGMLSDYDISVSETHHSLKKDAPSGTALRLARIAAQCRGGRAPAVVSQRIGDVVGEHTLTLAGPCERLELTHRAHSRDLFARGALRAALWLAGRRPGLYDMPDMLGQ